MISGTEIPNDRFSIAYLLCSPKIGGHILEPNASRRLFIVGSMNRIIVSILKESSERVASDRISVTQRGFIKGRSMLRNMMDTDFAPQKVSIIYKVGAIILFDCKSAFPSLDQDFMWEVLETFGIPWAFINASTLFDKDNTHILRQGPYEATSIIVRSRIRQGCPMSPIRNMLGFAASNIRGDIVC